MPDISKAPFHVPHYHVLLRSGYRVWTYEHGRYAPRAVRLLTTSLIEQGNRPIILLCRKALCRLYGDGTLTPAEVQDRIDAERHPDQGYVQIKPAPSE